MGAADLKAAADRAAKRRQLLKTPVKMMPDDPENLKISKAMFTAKRRKQREEELAVEQFKKDRKEKLTHPAIAEEGEVKKGRPKKVE